MCEGSFSHHHIANKDPIICRYCEIRTTQDEKIRALQQKADDNAKVIHLLLCRVNALVDFTSANVGPDTGNAVTPNADSSLQNLTTANNSVSIPKQDTTFRVVKNGVKPAAARPSVPITTSNGFQVLDIDDGVTGDEIVAATPPRAVSSPPPPAPQAERRRKRTTRRILPMTTNRPLIVASSEVEPHNAVLAGDSIVRQQNTEFAGRAPNSRKVCCIPGAGIDDLVAARDEVTDGANNNTLFVLHVGTNDVQRTRSEELLQKYRDLIKEYKAKSNNILISGILPKMSAENVFYSKAFSINNRLKSLCLQEGIEFVDTWNHFYRKPDLFNKDGLHLNEVGSARLGRLLNEAVRSFWAKNVRQVTPEVTVT